MLSEVETSESYLGRDDSFFYSLVFDATNQTLLADKGRIDVGDRHQADVPERMSQSEIGRDRNVKPTAEAATASADNDDDDAMSGDGLQIADGDEDMEVTAAAATAAAESTAAETKIDEAPPAKIAKISVTDHESIVYHPHHGLSDREIDQFLIIARFVFKAVGERCKPSVVFAAPSARFRAHSTSRRRSSCLRCT